MSGLVSRSAAWKAPAEGRRLAVHDNSGGFFARGCKRPFAGAAGDDKVFAKAVSVVNRVSSLTFRQFLGRHGPQQ